MIPAHAVSHPSAPSPTVTESARLVDVHGRALPLVAARLETRAGGGLARVLLEQRFHNPHDEPLRVTYQLPLPADAAVSGFVPDDLAAYSSMILSTAARSRFSK